MRHRIGIIIAILLVAGAVLCTVRWKAWFSMPPEPEWTEDTLAYRFVTFDDSLLQTKQQTHIHFLLLGDVHQSLDSSDYAALYQRHQQVDDPIDFYAQLGDWIERPYVYYEQDLMHAIRATGIDQLPVVTTPGNHEYHKGIRRHLSRHWIQAYPHVHNGPIGLDEGNYYLDFPSFRLVVINTNSLHTIRDYTRMNHWAKQVLGHDNTTRRHIVMMHHPVYSTAKGRQNPLIWLTFARSLNRAELVFSGHDHNYVRQSVWHPDAILWRDLNPTVYIATNASGKQYPCKEDASYDYNSSGVPVYEDIHVVHDTIFVSTRRVDNGMCMDEVIIPHRTN